VIATRAASQCKTCTIAGKPHLPHSALVHRVIDHMLALGCTIPDVQGEIEPYL
jgi:hypothetical protein